MSITFEAIVIPLRRFAENRNAKSKTVTVPNRHYTANQPVQLSFAKKAVGST